MADPKKPRVLTPQQQRFVAEYVQDWNGTQAALRSGYAPSSAADVASRLLRHPEIAAYIDQCRDEIRKGVSKRVALAADRTLQTMADLAYYDVREMFHEDGTVKPIKAMGDAEAAAIAGFEVTVSGKGENQTVTTKVRLVSRAQAVDMAAKVAGAYKADNDQRRNAKEMTDAELMQRAMTLMGMGAPEGVTVQ
jgi:phage terminase small subunit